MTVNGEIKFTFHPATPVVSEEANKEFADFFMDTIKIVAGTKVPKENISAGNLFNNLSIPSNSLSIAAFAGGLYGIGIHANAWTQFFSNLKLMKDSIPDDNVADFWAALNFWIFFAVGHPLLQPILWISDVLHGSPGPLIANLVPASFLVGNLVAIYFISNFKEVSFSFILLISLNVYDN